MILDDAIGNPVAFNGTFLVEIVAFLLLVGFLAKFVWPVISKALDERQKAIAQTIAEAQKTQDEAQARLNDSIAELEKSRREAQGIVNQASQTGEALRQELAKKAQDEAERTLARAKEEIELARNQAVQGLQTQVSQLVVEAAQRLVNAELDAKRHADLIDQAVKQVAELGRAG